MENSDRHWFSDHSGLGKSYLQDTASSKNLFTTYKSVNVAVFAVQFWTNWFTNSSFCRDTTWGCFKIRDTQKVNRSSEPLDLGAGKSWETPGKLRFTTIPSYWDQFWVVSPGWYESTLSTTPKTPRKVIPVEDSSGEKLGIGSSWANSEWKSHDPKWLDGPSCSRSWKFTSDLFHLDLNRSFKFFSCILEIAQIANAGTMWHALQWIFQLHGAFSTSTLHVNTKTATLTHVTRLCHQLGFLLCRSQDISICIQNFEHETTPRFFNFLSRQTRHLHALHVCCCHVFSSMASIQAMLDLDLASLQSQATDGDENWRECCGLVLLTGNVTGVFFFSSFWCGNCDMVVEDVWVGVAWWGSFFPWIVLAMLWW